VAAVLGATNVQTAILIAVFGGGAVGALLLTVETGVERNEQLDKLLRFPVKRVRDLEADDVGVTPEAPEALADLGRLEGDFYVWRDINDGLDAELEEALRADRTRLIVVSGPSKVGKTRTLFEATRRTMPKALLAAPRSFESVDELVRPGVLPSRGSRPLVLWLDDLEQFVRISGRGMRHSLLAKLDGRKGPVVVLATAGGKGLQAAGEVGGFSSPMQDLLAHARRFDLSPELSERERRGLADVPPEVAERIAREGIGEYMVGAQGLKEKLLLGSYPYGAPESPHGQAVAYTVIDWHRSGIVDPIPLAVLREAYGYYLRDHLDPDDAGFAEGLRWAREPLYSTAALVSGRGDEFRAHDLLVRFVEFSTQKEIDMGAWRCFLRGASDEQALDLAIRAYMRGEGEPEDEWNTLAGEAAEQAMGAPDPAVTSFAAYVRAAIRADRGEYEEGMGEVVVRAERDAELDNAAIGIAFRLIEWGEYEPAESVLRVADEAGSPVASLNLGVMLYRRGEEREAMEVFRRAKHEDFVDVLPYVRQLLVGTPEMRQTAEEALRHAHEGGCTLAGITLAHIHDLSGEREGALEIMRQAAEARDFVAAMKVVGILSAEGREDEAEEALQFAREIREEQLGVEGPAPDPS
jgi:tetratricopeptide (TPR) repeat protein